MRDERPSTREEGDDLLENGRLATDAPVLPHGRENGLGDDGRRPSYHFHPGSWPGPSLTDVERELVVQEIVARPYHKVIRGDDLDGYLAEAPELPGCVTAGETVFEAPADASLCFATRWRAGWTSRWPLGKPSRSQRPWFGQARSKLKPGRA